MGLGGAQGCLRTGHEICQRARSVRRPISTFQVNAFKLADMAMEIECARLLLYKACWLRDQDNPSPKRPPWPSYTVRKSWAGQQPGRPAPRRLRPHERIRRGTILPGPETARDWRGNLGSAADRHRPTHRKLLVLRLRNNLNNA